jgi:uroporphyrinogen-III synthase
MKCRKPLGILITRPAHQAKTLAQDIQTQGGLPICFPTLEIVGLNNTLFLYHTLKKLADYNFVIFISANAVFHAAHALHHMWPSWPINTKTIAIGPGTLAALQQYALPADYYPEKIFSSEGLLQLPILQNPRQKKILIIKGQAGDAKLYQTLKKRGAQVNVLDVYKRQLPAVINTIPHPNTIDIILCTSQTSLKNLLRLLYPIWKEKLLSKSLLLISQRTANYAKKRGFVKPALIADNASNNAILQTLFTCRE